MNTNAEAALRSALPPREHGLTLIESGAEIHHRVRPRGPEPHDLARLVEDQCPSLSRPDEGDRNRERSDPPLRRTVSRGGRRLGRERNLRTSFGEPDVAPAASSAPKR